MSAVSCGERKRPKRLGKSMQTTASRAYCIEICRRDRWAVAACTPARADNPPAPPTHYHYEEITNPMAGDAYPRKG